jgi:uncharacterized protein (DUF1800 family)
MALIPKNSPLTLKDAAHLLRRLTFGASITEIDAFVGKTPQEAITIMFTPTAYPLPPIALGEVDSWINRIPAKDEKDDDYQGYFLQWYLGQVLGANVVKEDYLSFSTREKITFFLHTFLTTIQETVSNSRALYHQFDFFRHFAFDTQNELTNIKALTKKICIDNAMLQLLDGRLNVKGDPNENFARELLELYTIGKGLSGQLPDTGIVGDYFNYTELDVQAAAKVLTGWDTDKTFSTLDTDFLIPRGKLKVSNTNEANQHDNDVKQFSNRFQSKTIAPNPTLLLNGKATEASVLDEIDQLIELIYAQEETAKHICRRIYRFYVHHEITESIDKSIIAEMVKTLKNNEFKIEPVIRELVQSEHFYSDGTASILDNKYGALIKSPIEIMGNTYRYFNYQLPDYLLDNNLFYAKTKTLIESLNVQGMHLLNPSDVAGYDAYHQFPLFNRMWINTNALTQRYKIIFDSLQIEKIDEEAISIDLVTFVENNFNDTLLADPEAFIHMITKYLFCMNEDVNELTSERYGWFKSEFLKLGKDYVGGGDAYWVLKWSNRKNSVSDLDDARGMLQLLFNAILQSPEYQLM